LHQACALNLGNIPDIICDLKHKPSTKSGITIPENLIVMGILENLVITGTEYFKSYFIA